MGMRKKEILPEEGVRVYQRQPLSLGQKLAIAGGILLVVMMIVGICMALRWKNKKEEAERLANMPPPPNYLNQSMEMLPYMRNFFFSGDITGFKLADYLPPQIKAVTKDCDNFYVDGIVDVNEISVSIYKYEETGDRVFITTLIYNETGGYMDVTNYYQLIEDYDSEVGNAKQIYTEALDNANYIEITNSIFTDRDTFMNVFLSVIETAELDSNTSYATDNSKENSYSIKFSPVIFAGDIGNTLIGKMFSSSSEDILSSVVLKNEAENNEITVAFQQGESVCSLYIKEDTGKYYNSYIYSTEAENLDNAIAALNAAKVKPVEETKEENTEENAENEENSEEE